jgi:hypothetical protein
MVEQTTFIEDNEKGVATHLEDSSYKGYEESRPSAFDEEQERILTKQVLRKLDVRALPMLAILFLFSFLDRYVESSRRILTITEHHPANSRTNIGNAKVLGLQKDLKLTNSTYSNCLCVFFAFYIASEGMYLPYSQVGSTC